MAHADRPVTTFPPKVGSSVDQDHVTWQSSQRCEVLSRLMVSTEKQFGRGTSPTASQGSFHGTFSSPQSDSGSHSSSSFKYPNRRPISRARTSQGNNDPGPRLHPSKSKSKSTTSIPDHPSHNQSPIPFFDKENPARFFSLLKGVSARVDENAGVRNHDDAEPSAPTVGVAEFKRKRPQLSSRGWSPAAKRIRESTPISGSEVEDGGTLNEFEPSHLIRDPNSDAKEEFNEPSPQESCPATTKLHPLLQKASSMTLTPSYSSIPDSGSALSSPCTSTPNGKYSSRPPVLGMRRTRTMPSQTGTTPDLPTVAKRKFKPPLLPSNLK